MKALAVHRWVRVLQRFRTLRVPDRARRAIWQVATGDRDTYRGRRTSAVDRLAGGGRWQEQRDEQDGTDQERSNSGRSRREGLWTVGAQMDGDAGEQCHGADVEATFRVSGCSGISGGHMECQQDHPGIGELGLPPRMARERVRHGDPGPLGPPHLRTHSTPVTARRPAATAARTSAGRAAGSGRSSDMARSTVR